MEKLAGKFNIKIGSGGKWIHSVGLGFLCIPLGIIFAIVCVFIIVPLCIVFMPIAGLFGVLKLEEK